LGDLSTPAGFQALRDALGRLAPDTIEGNAQLKNFLLKLGELRAEMPRLLGDLGVSVQGENGNTRSPAPLYKERSPLIREPQPIDLDRVVVVTKQSKVQYDMERYGWSYDQLQEEYARGPEDKSRILKSHQRQLAALEVLACYIDPARIVSRNDLLVEDVANASLVIAFGGDNHLQFVSHYIEGDTPLWGVNSDPQTSFGALLGGEIRDLPAALGALSQGAYRFEPWTRLQVEVDGRFLPAALCDVYIGERERKYMSRHRLEVTDSAGVSTSIEQKSSGMLISSGAGSSGWAKSAGRYLHGGECDFSRESRYARFLLTEPSSAIPGRDDSRQSGPLPSRCEGILLEGERLVVHSLNDSEGIVSIDSLEEIPFPRGRTITVRIDPNPLWVPVPSR
jgi:NAD+ kinase